MVTTDNRAELIKCKVSTSIASLVLLLLPLYRGLFFTSYTLLLFSCAVRRDCNLNGQIIIRETHRLSEKSVPPCGAEDDTPTIPLN